LALKHLTRLISVVDPACFKLFDRVVQLVTGRVALHLMKPPQLLISQAVRWSF